MEQDFNWCCPFCNRHCAIGSGRLCGDDSVLNLNNAEGQKALRVLWIVCPAPDCRKFTLTATLHDAARRTGDGRWIATNEIKTWRLIPGSSAKVFPDYIPRPITEDYQEACAIRDLSPKASSTLARRCLQGMIRDYWNIRKGTLVQEIASLEELVDPLTWKAIDAVRSIGNIG